MTLELQALRSEALELELLPEVGGRIHRLRAFGEDLLRAPPDPAQHVAEPFFWGSFPLVPWSNRVAGGVIRFRGRAVALPRNEGTNALHGEAYARPWRVLGEGLLAFDGGGFGFPWPYAARQRFSVDGARLTQALSITNTGAEAMPAGLGIHPWFCAPLELALPARLAYPLVDCIPTGEPEPVAGRLDLRALRPLPWGLDNLWTGLTAQQFRLRWPSRGLALDYAFSEAAQYAVVASFERFDAVAVEAVTHASDGFRLLDEGKPSGMRVLQPGATLTVTYTFSVFRAAAGVEQA